MGIPPERDWLAYCVDEALHVLSAGHATRDDRWREAFRRDRDDYGGEDGAGNLYDKAISEGGLGKPPSAAGMRALALVAGDGQDAG